MARQPTESSSPQATVDHINVGCCGTSSGDLNFKGSRIVGGKDFIWPKRYPVGPPLLSIAQNLSTRSLRVRGYNFISPFEFPLVGRQGNRIQLW